MSVQSRTSASCALPHIEVLQKIDQDGDLLEEISEIFSLPFKNVEKVYILNGKYTSTQTAFNSWSSPRISIDSAPLSTGCCGGAHHAPQYVVE
ncbi:MAG: hypothetical protein AAGF11_02805 [Myxococcota bacterium]